MGLEQLYTNLIKCLPEEFKPGERIGSKGLPDNYNSYMMSKFTRTKIEANLNHFHPFGSPVYVLTEKLQKHNSRNKWSNQPQVRIFICHLPFHASNVPFLQNTQTGNVSPQLCCIYNDDFTTCKHDAKFTSLCQHKVKLKSKLQTKTVIDVLPNQQESQPYQLSGASITLPIFV